MWLGDWLAPDERGNELLQILIPTDPNSDRMVSPIRRPTLTGETKLTPSVYLLSVLVTHGEPIPSSIFGISEPTVDFLPH